MKVHKASELARNQESFLKGHDGSNVLWKPVAWWWWTSHSISDDDKPINWFLWWLPLALTSTCADCDIHLWQQYMAAGQVSALLCSGAELPTCSSEYFVPITAFDTLCVYCPSSTTRRCRSEFSFIKLKPWRHFSTYSTLTLSLPGFLAPVDQREVITTVRKCIVHSWQPSVKYCQHMTHFW